MSTPLLALLALIAPGNPHALADAPSARHSQPAPVELVVDAKNAETLHGVKKFKVIVQTDEVVTQVEFYVNGELRTSEQSTPYRFELDTLNENDGDLAIKFIAYTDQTHKGTKEFKFTVDNGVAKGADFHVKAGAALLADGKLDEAVTEGRIALKADKTSAAARLLLARAFLFGNVLDKAQKYADDVVADDKNNLEALELSSVIGLKQAFTTAAKSLDDSETLKTVKDVLKTAVEARQRYLDGAVEKLGAGASLLAVADANTRAGHYTTEINILTPEFGKDHTRLEVANRLIYAQIK